MRKVSIAAAIALAMVLGSYAMAKDAAAKPLHGKVTAFLKDNSTAKIVSITISSHAKVKGDPDVVKVIWVDDSTKVTRQGDTAAATLADVSIGSIINVTLGDQGKPATAIEIRAPKKKAA